jgi:hypothetical protein
MAKLNVGDIIEVHGFTMLRGMKGKLRVAYADVYMGEKHAYWFTRPKGIKPIVGHLVSDVDAWIENGSDINFIEVKDER